MASPSGKQLTEGYERMLKVGKFSLEDLSVVRLPLETTMARLAALNRTDEHLEALEATQKILGNPRRSLESQCRSIPQSRTSVHAAFTPFSNAFSTR